MRFTSLLGLLCCFFAATAVSAKDFKMATVDLKKLFNEYPGTKTAQKKFQAMAEKKKQDLTDSAEELSDLRKELQGSKSVMSEKERKRKENEYQTKAQALSQQESQIQNDLASKEADMTGELVDQIKAIVAKVAQDKGVDLVMDSDKTIYARDAVDLTKDVLKNYKDSDSK